MATSPFGNFADLSSYRRAVDASRAASGSPLDELIAGFTQGQAIRNIPQTLQLQRQKALEEELARRLNNAIMQQKLDDLQNPDAALAREVQKSLAISSANPVSGVVSMPVGLAGETIGQPGALTVEQQLALEAGGASPTVAPLGVPINPITLAGAPTGFGQDLTRAAQATEALSTAKGQSALERLILGNETRRAIAEAGNASRERAADEKNKTAKEIADDKAAAKKAASDALFGEGARPIYDPNDPTKIIGYQVPKNFKSIADLKIEPIQSASKEFTEQRNARNLQSVEELEAAVSPFTVGMGSLLSKIPGTAAADFKANVDTLKANIAFSELQQMRAASKTGGALGQVAVRELELLQSALGALDTSQSTESFLSNLAKIKTSISNFRAAQGSSPAAGSTVTEAVFASEDEARKSGKVAGDIIILNGRRARLK